MNADCQRYAISDWNSAPARGALGPGLQAARLAAEGVDFFQLREKELSGGALITLAREVRDALAGTSTRLLINGRCDVALAVGAHGVHLTSGLDDLTPDQIHRLFAAAGKIPLVTLSCHSLPDVERAARQPLTAILFGPVHGKTVKGRQVAGGVGLERLRDACRLAAPLPVFALGGITAGNTADCLRAGAAGVAGIRLFER